MNTAPDVEKSNLSSVLKALIRTKGLSESELARRTDIGQPVIHRMISGETSNPKIATLRPIAHYFEISIDQLIGDEPLPKSALPGKYSEEVRRWTQVPMLNWQQVLRWPELSSDEIATYVSTDADVSENAYALTIKDSTMLPRFPEGTVAIIDPSYMPRDCDFAVVHIEGQKLATLKQILIDGEEMYIKPLNADFNVKPLTGSYQFLGVMVQARINCANFEKAFA
jgi:SOS-response transcriptional repressor LexA